MYFNNVCIPSEWCEPFIVNRKCNLSFKYDQTTKNPKCFLVCVSVSHFGEQVNLIDFLKFSLVCVAFGVVLLILIKSSYYILLCFICYVIRARFFILFLLTKSNSKSNSIHEYALISVQSFILCIQ